ncbi:MAG: glycosyltransferase [Eubacteriales bacterium]|nr:glycosyltransferase [Eubacteriales bacterium]
MSRKILFTASTKSHIENFHLPYLHSFEEMGWEVKALALPVSKSFFSFKNLQVIFSTSRLLLSEGFDVISSQSTLAGIVTRLAVLLARKTRLSKKISSPDKQVKIFHTAHGYLFHDDNTLKKWAYILPEILCGKITDVLMLMNQEDLEIARKYKLGGKRNKIYYIDGMGIDLTRFQQIQTAPPGIINEWKNSFGIKENDFAFVYAAEFSKRKNHELLLKGFAQALAVLKKSERSGVLPDNMKLVLAGDGVLLDETKALAHDLGISSHVLFPGYVRNIPELYACCQATVTTSRIEGLPFNVMEAMAIGLPVIASDIKGHRELITHGENGLLFELGDQKELTKQIIEIYKNTAIKEKFSITSMDKVKQFSIEKVLPDIMSIYHKNM